MPDVAQYSAIGFDIDMCLVRYQIIPITRLSFNAFMSSLVADKQYPKEMLDLSEEDMAIALNYCILDLEFGNLLKLGENKEVLRAYHGFTRLSQSEVTE